jgi:hypothetical protein
MPATSAPIASAAERERQLFHLVLLGRAEQVAPLDEKNQRRTIMGMDVIGNEEAYFRNNVWRWRPLADYICRTAPDVALKCKHWQTNDGDGLNEADSLRLAEVLSAEIESGRTKAYAIRYRSEQEATPNEPCEICEGTGTRLPWPQVGPGNPKLDGVKCKGCNGTGYRRPWSCSYRFEVENVQEFVRFLRSCGGFKIY